VRIVIRVIASKSVGLGHVYRALTLAEEFESLGHEVLFAGLASHSAFIRSIIEPREFYAVFHEDKVSNFLDLPFKPDLFINDTLDTAAGYIDGLKAMGYKVVNFEDLGPGADHADLVINALFQEPQREGDHYLWGIDHFFLRDEFIQARQAPWSNKVDSVLVTFGGTDQTDLTWKTVNAIAGLCRRKGITLYIVVGPGYPEDREKSLMQLLWDWGLEKVFFIRETGSMAQIMSRCQVAFCSNGRTIYELTHMHVPSVVVAHSKRENTHDFAQDGNGFVNLGVYREGIMSWIQNWGGEMIERNKFRRRYWNQMQRFDLSGNKARVAKRILEVADER
jgi:spore coat polysaccharide biosynthesis predicted glycosyltransferase SpsG